MSKQKRNNLKKKQPLCKEYAPEVIERYKIIFYFIFLNTETLEMYSNLKKILTLKRHYSKNRLFSLQKGLSDSNRLLFFLLLLLYSLPFSFV